MKSLKRLESLFYIPRIINSPSIERMTHILGVLHSPHKEYPTVHIAGTNGKGSVTWKIAKAYEYAGYTVGCYTSPHIEFLYERIAVNSHHISEEDMEKYLSQIFSVADQYQMECTFFEYITLVMFCYFRDQKVDIAIIEVGLGGRLDSTNVIEPLVAIITSISLDHTQFLGNSEEQIAREKAGIIKPYADIVVGPTIPISIVSQYIDGRIQQLVQVKEKYENFELENQAIAKAALHLLQKKITIRDQDIEEGIRYTPPCRYQRLDRALLIKKYGQAPSQVILDVAHNPDGIAHLLYRLKQDFDEKPVFVFGISNDKDIARVVTSLVQHAQALFIVDNFSKRACPASMILDIVQQYQRDILHTLADSDIPYVIGKAYEYAVEKKCPLVVCGSFYIMADARRFFL